MRDEKEERKKQARSMYILTQVKLTQVKLTFYCFATLSLLKLVAFIIKLKFTVAELAIHIMQHTDNYSVYSQLGS